MNDNQTTHSHNSQVLLPTNYLLLTNTGQAAITLVLFILLALLSVSFAFSSVVLSQERIVRSYSNGAQSFFVAESGHEDAVFRIKTGKNVGNEEAILLSGHVATTTVVTSGDTSTVTSSGDVSRHLRNIESTLTLGSSVSFGYGLHSGIGGVVMENDSMIRGNLYSNGPVSGDGNTVGGTAVSAGASGSIDDIRATSSAYAHVITDSTIDGDAYYDSDLTSTGNTYLGGNYTGSPDQPTTTLPITDAQIVAWEAEAEAGGTISSPCPYVIDSDETIGPVKITCDLNIKSNGTDVTLGGHVWVVGDIEIQNSSTVSVSTSLPGKTIALIADNPSDRLSQSKIVLKNGSQYFGSGDNSYVLIISQNESAEQSGSEVAIEIQNNAEGDLLLYAKHGEILIQNNAVLTSVTAYKVHTKNNSEVIYESGLDSVLFEGSSGGYEISEWREIE
jgi:hypothetical protein